MTPKQSKTLRACIAEVRRPHYAKLRNILPLMNKENILNRAVTVTALAIACFALEVRADSTAPDTHPAGNTAQAPALADSAAPSTQSTKNTASGATTAIASGANSTALAVGSNASSGGASNRHERGVAAPFVGIGGILTISGISEIVLDGNHFMPDTMAHWVAPEKAEDCKIELCTKDGRHWTATWVEVKK
jgi:hypothetical protein